MTIKEARKEAKLTQDETAKALGVSKRTIEDWEAGRRNPKMGQEYWAERIVAIGCLTDTGREALASGEISMYEALAMAKRFQAKKASRIGSLNDTFSACWDRIPETVVDSLPATSLAELVDALYVAYSDGKSAR